MCKADISLSFTDGGPRSYLGHFNRLRYGFLDDYTSGGANAVCQALPESASNTPDYLRYRRHSRPPRRGSFNGGTNNRGGRDSGGFGVIGPSDGVNSVEVNTAGRGGRFFGRGGRGGESFGAPPVHQRRQFDTHGGLVSPPRGRRNQRGDDNDGGVRDGSGRWGWYLIFLWWCGAS